MTNHIEETKAMIAVMQAYVDGAPIENVGTGFMPNEPAWDWVNYDYRIAITPDTIDWAHVAPEYKWMARDENGTSFLYQSKPSIGPITWEDTRLFCSNATSRLSYRRGTCDWKDSLVERPA